jgi:predicted metalloprotease
MGQSAMGPFYCPPDQRVYLDLSFFDELERRFRVSGNFPQAYVIAHEVGHHVQNLLASPASRPDAPEHEQARRQRHVGAGRAAGRLPGRRLGLPRQPRARRHRAHHDKDVEQAVTAATAIGDDRLQRQATGRVMPDSFTHGSSAQRVRWLKIGLDSGDVPEVRYLQGVTALMDRAHPARSES